MIFDKNVKRLHRNRAANTIIDHDFLLQEANAIFEETLNETITEKFPHALNIGCASDNLANVKSIERITQMDSAHNILGDTGIVADEEALPFAPESFNLVASNLLLHWTNDLPSCLRQIRTLLKDRGLFVGVIFGGMTLTELRQAALSAEIDDGASPRVSPFVHIKDAGALLQHAGFHIPVADSQTIQVKYDHAFDLFADLRAMGESNALIARHKELTSRSRLGNIAQKYAEMFSDENGQICATFELITLTGWKN